MSILIALTRNTPLAPELKLNDIAFSKKTERFSGADLSSLVKEACINAIEDKRKVDFVSMKHFMDALKNIKPSVSVEDQKRYEKLKENLIESKSILKRKKK